MVINVKRPLPPRLAPAQPDLQRRLGLGSSVLPSKKLLPRGGDDEARGHRDGDRFDVDVLAVDGSPDGVVQDERVLARGVLQASGDDAVFARRGDGHEGAYLPRVELELRSQRLVLPRSQNLL